MRTILVATDGSQAATAALDAAVALAAETGDEIVAITVWRALQGDYGLAHPSAAVLDDLLTAERVHAEAALEDANARANAAGVQIRTRLGAGDPAREICAYAKDVDARLIAVGTRG
jgi:nucleotide-binding universal stress UspA family protein